MSLLYFVVLLTNNCYFLRLFRGTLKIAEVESRFQNLSVEEFIAKVQKFGFKLKWKDENEKYFVFMDFKKVEKTKKKVPELQLKPCFYKKR